MSDAPTRLLHFSSVKQEHMLSERKQEEKEKMVSNDDDCFGVICLKEEWGLPTLICCQKRIHMECLERCLGDGRQCPHCRQSLLDLLVQRVYPRFRDFYKKMVAIHIADGGHIQPRLNHKWNF